MFALCRAARRAAALTPRKTLEKSLPASYTMAKSLLCIAPSCTLDGGSDVLRRMFSDTPSVQSEPESVEVTASTESGKPRTFTVKVHNLRVAPKKLNPLTQLVAGMNVDDALAQLMFSKKRYAKVLHDLIHQGINKAHAQAEVPIEHLRVSQAMVNLAGRLKRMKAMGRGRTGTNIHRYSHLVVILEEAAYREPWVSRKQKWMLQNRNNYGN